MLSNIFRRAEAFLLPDRAPWWGVNISSKTGTEAVITGVTALYHSKLQNINHWPLQYIENNYETLKCYPRRSTCFSWKTGNPFPRSTTMLLLALYGKDQCRLSRASVSTCSVDFSLSTFCLHTTFTFPLFLLSASINKTTYFGTSESHILTPLLLFDIASHFLLA